MITLYRTEDCPACTDVQEALRDMTMAHKVLIVHGKEDIGRRTGIDAGPPLLVDGKESFEGIAPILEHLKELEEFKRQWEKYQTDTCCCDEDDDSG